MSKVNFSPFQIKTLNRDYNFTKLAHSSYLYLKLDVNVKNEQGLPPLSVACNYAQVDFVKFFISKRADVNSRDKRGNTPLMYAFESGSKEVIEILLNHGANLNLLNREGESAIDKCHPFLRQDTPWLQMIHDVYSGVPDYKPMKSNLKNSGFGMTQIGEKNETSYMD